MLFPFAAGFSGPSEHQSSDVFGRAVLGGLLLDIAGLVADDLRAQLENVAAREADHVARSKLRDRAGGWSYFPDLPELPPDIDSLAAALLLFARTGSEHVHLCDEPLSLALAATGPPVTWIVAPHDPRGAQEQMRTGIQRYWGNAVDAGVLARLYTALVAYDRALFQQRIDEGLGSPRSANRLKMAHGAPSGIGARLTRLRCVSSSCGLALAVHTLWKLRSDTSGVLIEPKGAGSNVRACPWTRPRRSGHSAMANCRYGPEAVASAVSLIPAYQDPDGSWEANPWIRMDIGRALRIMQRTISYWSSALTTAFCVRALLLAKKSVGEQGECARCPRHNVDGDYAGGTGAVGADVPCGGLAQAATASGVPARTREPGRATIVPTGQSSHHAAAACRARARGVSPQRHRHRACGRPHLRAAICVRGGSDTRLMSASITAAVASVRAATSRAVAS